MVQARLEKICAGPGRTKHLRNSGEPDLVAALLEMGADERNYLGCAQFKRSRDSDGFVLDRLGFGARFNLSDRSFRPFRDEAGLQLFGRQARRASAVQDADVI